MSQKVVRYENNLDFRVADDMEKKQGQERIALFTPRPELASVER